MQCSKCHKEMTKKGVLVSGNTRFEQYRCMNCWHEQSIALGVIGGVK